MRKQFKAAARTLFSVSQFLTVGAQFYLSIFAMIKSDSNQTSILPDASNESTMRNSDAEVIAISVACMTALACAVRSYQFQGSRIVDSEDEGTTMLCSRVPGRYAEIPYLLVEVASIMFANIFTVMLMKRFVSAIDGEDNHLKSLSEVEYLSIVAFTLLLELPFYLSNSIYEAATSFYDESTSNRALIKAMIKPLSNPYGIFLAESLGSVIHTLKHALSILLYFSAMDIETITSTELGQGLFYSGVSLFVLLAVIPNFILTLLFEGKESKENIESLNAHASEEMLPITGESSDASQDAVLKNWPRLKIYLDLCLMLTQSPLHGFDDAMPIYHFLMQKDLSSEYSIAIASSVALLSLTGVQLSEVDQARKELDAPSVSLFCRSARAQENSSALRSIATIN